MTSQFSPIVSEILAFSKEEAERLSSSSVGPAHILLGIMREHTETMLALWNEMNIDLRSIKAELEDKIKSENNGSWAEAEDINLNEQANNILKLAVLEARLQSTQTVDERHLLLAILHDSRDNAAKNILESNNMKYQDLYKYFYKS